MELEHIIEVILFSADRPLTTKEIAKIVKRGFAVTLEPTEPSESETTATENSENVAAQKELEMRCVIILQDLKIKWQTGALMLQEIAGGWRLGTEPKFAPWVRLIYENLERSRVQRLTQPSLETLAIIAYRQPISRAEIEAVRGVAAGGVLETLIERGVVRVAGRAETPGRPLLYETTPYFLEHFGLRALDELPNVEELKKIKLPEPLEAQQSALIHEITESAS